MRYYAGIGSRETPQDILHQMKNLAQELEINNYILRSGGAKGADLAFESGVSDKTHKEIFYPNKNMLLNQFLIGKLKDVCKDLRVEYDYVKDTIKPYLIRNMAQIVGLNERESVTSFVLCWTEGGKMVGGTRYALRLAERIGVPIYNFAVLSLHEIREKIL